MFNILLLLLIIANLIGFIVNEMRHKIHKKAILATAEQIYEIRKLYLTLYEETHPKTMGERR